MSPTSANTITLNIVKSPAMIQVTKIKAGEPNKAAISAGLMKMPEPIIVVITIAVAVENPIVLEKPWD
jgi:hypothetical protein